MAATLKTRINDDVKTAMRAAQKQRLGVLRLINAAIKQKEVDDRVTLDDDAVIAVLEKMAKQRRESIDIYRQGARPDLVEQESFELDVIKGYLPTPLSAEQLQTLLEKIISDTGATGIKDMGKVMNALRPLVHGRADMAQVSAELKCRLSGPG